MPHILVVDDEPEVRDLIHRTLARDGHEVHEAEDGQVAIDVLARLAIRLVITDLLMPNREGIETIRAIRQRWPQVPILAISGSGDRFGNVLLKAAGELGANEVLAKPFRLSALRAAVERCLSLQAAPDGERP